LTSARLRRLKSRRQTWLRVHLYLGLFVGAVLAVVGFTGGILVFYEELQDVLNAEQIRIQAPPASQRQLCPLDDIIAAAETIKPPGSRLDKLYYPRHADTAYKLLYHQPAPAHAESGEQGDGYYVFVNPYNAQATGKQLWHPYQRYWGRPLVSFIMQLHYCLLLDTPGVIFVGIVSAFAIISILTGLIVWWPLTGNFRTALTIKPRASLVRFNFDLHKIVGVYSAAVFLVVVFSGVYFNLPEQVNVLVKQFSPLQRPNAWEGMESAKIHSRSIPGTTAITPGQAEAIARHQYPNGQMWMLSAPADGQGIYYVWKRDVTELSRFIGYREIAIDQYSGEILKRYDSGSGSAGDLFLDWQWPLHSGHAFGWPGRILVLLSGLACPVLYATGVIRWLQKRRAKSAAAVIQAQKNPGRGRC